MIGSAFRLRNDVIHGQVPEWEVDSTPGAMAFLPPVERMAVRSVVREQAEVGPLRNVRPTDDLTEDPVLIPKPEPVNDFETLCESG